MKKNKFLLTLSQTEEYLYSSYEMTKQLRELYNVYLMQIIFYAKGDSHERVECL